VKNVIPDVVFCEAHQHGYILNRQTARLRNSWRLKRFRYLRRFPDRTLISINSKAGQRRLPGLPVPPFTAVAYSAK
jgi:hypothetical protein